MANTFPPFVLIGVHSWFDLHSRLRAFSRYGHGDELHLRQNEFAQLNRYPSYLKNREQMDRQSVNESFYQSIGPGLNEVLHFRANGGVVNGSRDVIA